MVYSNTKKIFLFIFILSIPATYIYGYSFSNDSVFWENIKTVRIHKAGWEFSFPVITLHSDEQIKLGFDLLNSDLLDFNYTITHCDRNGNPSNLIREDYVAGYEFNEIKEYKYSTTTTVDYIHYNLFLPNEDIEILKSGNYLVNIFHNNKLVLVKRFYVQEDLLNLTSRISRPIGGTNQYESQRIELTIPIGNINFIDPARNISTHIIQNQNQQNIVVINKPDFISTQELRYNMNPNLIIEAGNEFRHADLKSTRYASIDMEVIKYEPPYYNAYLKPDMPRTYDLYSFEKDINGNHSIEREKGIDGDNDADYWQLHFELQMDYPFPDGDVYVNGALCNWKLTDQNKMEYNTEKKAYTKTLFLKQGYYTYNYIFKGHESGLKEQYLIEGSHFETENDYLIFIYYRDFDYQYDRIVGMKMINSLN